MDKLKHFQIDNNKETSTDYLKAAMIIIMWVLVWQIADLIIDNSIILVGPAEIVSTLL